ncbi:PH domain-containing protein [Aeromicrobium duanguangcaii]|uniref:PH domain-containing protein n=1 Tax=Aeromicrobium duanguangcaii TaxID=2968086 RepID=A0ABY5KKI6_9ACTN|nr:PH domain-containing protein [Aeromicrobium duanguangcaii]MCD9152923.1 PH domain-containing protein [Aeromicrobium duanguangcaii]UUI69971.1 PH domain-containing protein [Aeromicrobium duanguangcaii]
MAPASDAHRTHPLTALLQGLIWGAGVAVAVAWQVIDFDDPQWWSLLAVPGGFVIGVLAGLVSWLFTRYVIDEDEIRVDRGVIFRSSRRIPFERLQSVDINEPLIARVVGLSELTIEMAGGSDSRTTLRFLTLVESRRLRRLLLTRAHGTELTDESGELPAEEQRTVLHVVEPDQIIIGTLLSLDFVAAALTAVGSIVAAFLFEDVGWALLGLIVPATWGVGQMIMNRIVAQWNFTVSRGERGLRIERGLLSRSSQTIPYDRVQGIGVVEPIVWRRYGWSRLDVDVAGYGNVSEDRGGVSSTTLLPIATDDVARRIIEELIPDPERGTAPEVRPTRRSWIFAPIGWRFRSFAATLHTVTTTTGWITRHRSIVPHHKVQSVRLSQGPLQRRRGVATVQVHTPDGPVSATIKHLDAPVARDVTFDEVERARLARRLSRR